MAAILDWVEFRNNSKLLVYLLLWYRPPEETPHPLLLQVFDSLIRFEGYQRRRERRGRRRKRRWRVWWSCHVFSMVWESRRRRRWRRLDDGYVLLVEGEALAAGGRGDAAHDVHRLIWLVESREERRRHRDDDEDESLHSSLWRSQMMTTLKQDAEKKKDTKMFLILVGKWSILLKTT